MATDQYKYCTLSYDRLGIGNSSHGEPLNEIQSFLEVAALAELTDMLRNGTFPGVKTAFSKVTHVGHSFGSAQTYSLVNMYPDISDGIVLTGFSMNSTFVTFFLTGADFVLANLNQPFRFGNVSFATGNAILSSLASALNVSSMTEMAAIQAYGLTDYFAGVQTMQKVEYANGYLANKDVNTNQFLFFLPGHFDQGALYAGEMTKQPVTQGELLTLGSLPMTNAYKGPVLVLTGCKCPSSPCPPFSSTLHYRPPLPHLFSSHQSAATLPTQTTNKQNPPANDLPFCGGDCLATGDPALPSIPAAVQRNFPNVPAGDFEAYIQPNTGHGLNFHYNQTGSYDVIQRFLAGKGLMST